MLAQAIYSQKKGIFSMRQDHSTAVGHASLWPALAFIALFLAGTITAEYRLYRGSELPQDWVPVNDQLALALTAGAEDQAIAKASATVTSAKEPTPAVAVKSADSAFINLNEASLSELMTLKGIGEVKAKAIIAYRDQAGGFQSIDDLLKVKGIGQKTLENIRDRLKISP
jgi:competence protein ComEA